MSSSSDLSAKRGFGAEAPTLQDTSDAALVAVGPTLGQLAESSTVQASGVIGSFAQMSAQIGSEVALGGEHVNTASASLPGTNALSRQPDDTTLYQARLPLVKMTAKQGSFEECPQQTNVKVTYRGLAHLCENPLRVTQIQALGREKYVEDWLQSIVSNCVSDQAPWSLQYSIARDAYYITRYHQDDGALAGEQLVLGEERHASAETLTMITAFPVSEQRIDLDLQRYETLIGAEYLQTQFAQPGIALSTVPSKKLVARLQSTEEKLSSQSTSSTLRRAPSQIEAHSKLETKIVQADKKMPANRVVMDRTAETVADLQADFEKEIVRAEQLVAQLKRPLSAWVSAFKTAGYPQQSFVQTLELMKLVVAADMTTVVKEILGQFKIAQCLLEEIEETLGNTDQKKTAGWDHYNNSVDEYRALRIEYAQLIFPLHIGLEVPFQLIGKLLPLFNGIMHAGRQGSGANAERMFEQLETMFKEFGIDDADMTQIEELNKLLPGDDQSSSTDKRQELTQHMDYMRSHQKDFEQYCGDWIKDNEAVYARYQEVTTNLHEAMQELTSMITPTDKKSRRSNPRNSKPLDQVMQTLLTQSSLPLVSSADMDLSQVTINEDQDAAFSEQETIIREAINSYGGVKQELASIKASLLENLDQIRGFPFRSPEIQALEAQVRSQLSMVEEKMSAIEEKLETSNQTLENLLSTKEKGLVLGTLPSPDGIPAICMLFPEQAEQIKMAHLADQSLPLEAAEEVIDESSLPPLTESQQALLKRSYLILLSHV